MRDFKGRYASASAWGSRIGVVIALVLLTWMAVKVAHQAAFVTGLLSNTVSAENAPMQLASTAFADELNEVSARELIEAEKRQIVRDLSDKCEFQDKDAPPYTIDRTDSGPIQVVFGDYQFYPPTVVHFMKELRGEDVSLEGAVALAMDDARAFELAYEMIWSAGRIGEWGNCARKLGLEQRIEMVKAQEALVAALSSR